MAYALKPLTPVGKSSNRLKNKKQILETVWKKFTDNTKIQITVNVQVLVTPDIDGLNKIQAKDTPDIILLDYNFNNNQKSGVDFMKALTETESKRFGPFNKFWILPITSFSSSFIDELQNRGLGFIHKYYELSRGADFINTPSLFLFYLMQMIWQILNKVDLLDVKKEIEDISKKLDLYADWKALKQAESIFEKDYLRFVNSARYIEAVRTADTGILKNAKTNIENELAFIKQFNICKELLFNLTAKNYEGNEDIIILGNQLRETINQTPHASQS